MVRSKYRRRRITSPVGMRKYRRFNPPTNPMRTESDMSYEFIGRDEAPVPYSYRSTSDGFEEIGVRRRPYFPEGDLPIDPVVFKTYKTNFSEREKRKYLEAQERILRKMREEEEMILAEAYAIYPETGEAAKMLRNRYIKEREREIRDEEEEEFIRSERRRQEISRRFRERERREHMRRISESRRRTSPVMRQRSSSSKSGLVTRVRNLFAKRSSSKKTSSKKTSSKKTSSKRASPKRASPKRASPKRASPGKTSPKKRSKPKRTRIAKIEEWKDPSAGSK